MFNRSPKGEPNLHVRLLVARGDHLNVEYAKAHVQCIVRARRQARAARRIDRTRYTSRGRVSFLSHHTQRMSLSVVKADSRGILDSCHKLSASIARA